MPTDQEVLEILSDVCRVPAEQLKPDSRLIQDLDLDSMLALELLMSLEERLGTDITEAESAQMITVGDVLEFVRERAR